MERIAYDSRGEKMFISMMKSRITEFIVRSRIAVFAELF